MAVVAAQVKEMKAEVAVVVAMVLKVKGKREVV